MSQVIAFDEARRALRKNRAPRTNVKPGTLMESWEIYRARNKWQDLAPTSRVAITQVMERAVAELPARPTEGDVEIWLAKLFTQENKSARTRNKYLAFIKAVTHAAARHTHDHALADEMASVDRLRAEPARVRVPCDECVHYLTWVAPSDTAERAAVMLAATCGLRIQEIAALRPEDIDDHGGKALMLTVANTRDSYGVRRRKNAANERRHIVELTGKTAWHVLYMVNGRHEFARTPAQRRCLKEGWLFPWAPTHLARLWRKWLKEHPRLQQWVKPGDAWHILRHWAAAKVFNATGREDEVKALLGDVSSYAVSNYTAVLRGTSRHTTAITDAALTPPPEFDAKARRTEFSTHFLPGFVPGLGDF